MYTLVWQSHLPLLIKKGCKDCLQLKSLCAHQTLQGDKRLQCTMNELHITISCVLSDELEPTPLEAVQVMMGKALSLTTLVTLSELVTLSSAMESSVELLYNQNSGTIITQKHSMHDELGDSRRGGGSCPCTIKVSLYTVVFVLQVLFIVILIKSVAMHQVTERTSIDRNTIIIHCVRSGSGSWLACSCSPHNPSIFSRQTSGRAGSKDSSNSTKPLDSFLHCIAETAEDIISSTDSFEQL